MARKYYGSDNYIDSGLTHGEEDNILLGKYQLLYVYKDQVLSDGVIIKNIKNDYPILATFNYPGGNHDVVIYGINITGGYIYVMDPEYGFCSVNITSSGYQYVSGYSGTHLTQSSAACRYWSA